MHFIPRPIDNSTKLVYIGTKFNDKHRTTMTTYLISIRNLSETKRVMSEVPASALSQPMTLVPYAILEEMSSPQYLSDYYGTSDLDEIAEDNRAEYAVIVEAESAAEALKQAVNR